MKVKGLGRSFYYAVMILGVLSVILPRFDIISLFMAGYHSLQPPLQALWERVSSLANHDQFILHVFGSWILIMIMYWSFGLFFTFVDITNKPAFILKYKIQEANPTNYPIPLWRIVQVTANVLFNQTFVTIPAIYLCYLLKKQIGYNDSPIAPTLGKTILDIIGFIIIEEIMFYYSHRLLHTSLFYKYFHKQHHEFIAPISISAVYCHPLEHFFANALPTVLGPALLGSHVATQFVWLTFASPFGVIIHSGYHLPLLPSPEAHDFHHLKYFNNFGLIGFMDRLHGTDSYFRASGASKRHFWLLNRSPIGPLRQEDLAKDIPISRFRG